jgi:hypothetical protein
MVEGQSSSGGGTATWYRLTPSSTGSYVNGTWTTLASMPGGYDPLYFASAVLPDGRVTVVGGEYLGTKESETNEGAIYDPASNTWTAITPPTGWSHIGDAASVVRADGTWVIGNCGVTGTECTNQTYQAEFNATTLTWTIIGAGNGKADENSEEGWNLLPNGDVLTEDVSDGKNTEVFNPSTDKWTSAGNTVAVLPNSNCSEIGPAVLRPDGTVFAIGGTSNTGIYNTTTGIWTAGPALPSGDGVEDGPAAILPDGNVLIDISKSSPCYTTPSVFYEFNGTSLTSVPAPANAASDPTYVGRMLVLPTGQILFTDGSKTAEVYTAAGTYQSAWQPTISTVSSVLASASSSNAISGTQFNGLSQGGAYGDDAQMATNYPLVRITNNASGNVVYCKTHNHSTMAVATGSAIVSTEFDIPSTIQLGASELVVVANGIPSAAASVAIQDSTSTSVSASPASIANTASTTLSVTVTDTSNSANTPGGTVTFTDSTNSATLGSCTLSSGSCSISGAGSAMASGSNTITASYAGVANTYGSSSGTTPVTVTAAAANITFSSVTHNFGQVAVGTAATAYTLKVTNSSSNAYPFVLNFTAASGFTSATNCPSSIAAGGNCEIAFYFTPTSTAAVSDTWSLAPENGFTYAPSNGGTLSGSGTGSSGFSLTTAGHNFGTVSVGTKSATYGVVLSNSSSSAIALTLGSVTSPFASVTNCPATLAAGSSCNLQFTFTPAATGAVQQVYSISGNGGAVTLTSGGNTVTGITLSGTGQ